MVRSLRPDNIFAAAGALPTARRSLQELVHFQIDYTFWLNLVFLALGGALLYLRRPPGAGHVADLREAAPGSQTST